MKNIIVLYHKDHDGFGAAWAAWKKFGKKADYLPIQYKLNFSLPKKIKNKEVYLVDLCFDAEMMKKLLAENKTVAVIDHHIGRKEEIKISSDYLFDIKHSAAVLSWKFFHPDKKIPKLLLYVEDMDLWKFKLPYAREIFAFLEIDKFDFKLWNKLAVDFEDKEKIKKYIEAGKTVLKYKEKIVHDLIFNGENVVFEGNDAFVVNSPIFQSEIGEHIYKKKKKVAVIWSYHSGFIKGSLRSDKIDVSKIAQKYSGGGHKAAAGFYLKGDIKFPWKKVK